MPFTTFGFFVSPLSWLLSPTLSTPSFVLVSPLRWLLSPTRSTPRFDLLSTSLSIFFVFSRFSFLDLHLSLFLKFPSFHPRPPLIHQFLLVLPMFPKYLHLILLPALWFVHPL